MTQKITTFSGGYVQPKSKSNLTLSEGIYSLSSRCNLPYVTLTGSGGYTKTISWGEYAEVPCGEAITVINASAHPGNLYINSGIDPFPVPARITVPTPILSAGVEFGVAQTKYIFDVRRAKRAWLYLQANIAALTGVTVIGRTQDSLDTTNLIIGPNVGTGYETAHQIAALVDFPPIPLGFQALVGDDTRAMALLDTCLVTFDQDIGGVAAYFVAEYL